MGARRRGINISDEYEKAAEEVRKLFQRKGGKVLKKATASVLKEKFECDEVRKALSHFMSYWRDVVRPSLVSLACEAVGGDPSIAAPIGKSLTLLSGATDIHDDIIDKTMRKERRQTVLGRYGEDIALITGDILIFKGFAAFFDELLHLDLPLEKKLDIAHTVIALYLELGDAEALELKFRARVDVKPEEYLHVMKKKAADIEICTRVGALLGGGSQKQINALGKYGRLLGMIVLLRNDLEDLLDFNMLNLRIKYEALPLPILYALENDGKREIILEILKKGRVKREKAKRLFTLVSETEGLNKLWKIFEKLKVQAFEELTLIQNKTILKNILEASVPKTFI